MPHGADFIRIGTRGSPLALAQAKAVARQIGAAHDIPEADIAIVPIRTSGDRITEVPLSLVGGKGLFTKEIEEALLAHDIDVAVHSAKDVAAELPFGLTLPVFLAREDVRDAFISPVAKNLDLLPPGAKIGTSSLRRAAQMLHYRPDLTIVALRGNVGTRLGRIGAGHADATLLAVAGLNRLGLAHEITAYLDPQHFPPAPAQGAIALEIRATDHRAAGIIAPLHHGPTAAAVSAERAFLATLEGSCRTPIAAYTQAGDAGLTLLGQVLSPDGRKAYSQRLSGSPADAAALGRALAHALLTEAGEAILAPAG